MSEGGGGFGLYLGSGKPRFSVRVNGAWVVAAPDATGDVGEDTVLEMGRWHHLAGVYDGKSVALFVDGKRVAATPASGAHTPSTGSLLVGDGVRSDVHGEWSFPGLVDEVRVTRAAVYTEDFEPTRPLVAGDDTAVLLHMDAATGPWLYDSSPSKAHGRLKDGALLIWE